MLHSLNTFAFAFGLHHVIVNRVMCSHEIAGHAHARVVAEKVTDELFENNILVSGYTHTQRTADT